jgi:bifunctional non-homologous end joining protein LigD
MARSVPKSQRQYVKNSPAKLLAGKLAAAQGTPYPGFIKPSLATLRDKIPSRGAWLHEIKFDGYRLQLHIKNGKATALTRRGYDWTDRFKSLTAAMSDLDCYIAIIDGEVIVPTDNGLSDFGALESDLAKKRSDRFLFYAFDIIYLDGFDLRACPFIERRKVLETLFKKTKPPLIISETIEGVGSLLKNACKLELEGIVSKKKNGPYRSGRSANWTKVPCRKRETFIVVGIAYKGTKFDGIYLGRREKKALIYAGKVEHGISAAQQKELMIRATTLTSETQPLTKRIRKPKARWLKPKMLVDVEYRALTGDGKLRHPSYKGLREDL